MAPGATEDISKTPYSLTTIYNKKTKFDAINKMDISFVVPGEERKSNECQESSDPPGEKGTSESGTPKGTGWRSQKGSRAGQNGRKDIGCLHYHQCPL